MTGSSPQGGKSTLLDYMRPSFSLVGDGRLISWDQRDSMQGFLLFFIIVGHNYVLGGPSSDLFDWLYKAPTILVFMSLPLLTAVRPLSATRALDLTTRYMVPYLIFATAITLAYWLTEGSDRPWQTQLGYWAVAMLMNNAKASVTMVSSGGYLWFLPAFLAFQLSLGLFYRLGRRGAYLFLAALMLGFAFIGQGEHAWTSVLPFTFGVTIYCLPLSILIAHGLNRLQDTQHRLLLGGLLVLICIGLTLLTNSWDSGYRIHRTFVHTLLQADEFLLHAVRVVIGAIGVLLLAPLINYIRPFRWMGSNIVVIYLAHLPIYRVLLAVYKALIHEPVSLLDGMLLLAVTLAISCALAWAINSIDWLRVRIMPKNFMQLKQNLGLASTVSRQPLQPPGGGA
jgi:hypothetical protein